MLKLDVSRQCCIELFMNSLLAEAIRWEEIKFQLILDRGLDNKHIIKLISQRLAMIGKSSCILSSFNAMLSQKCATFLSPLATCINQP